AVQLLQGLLQAARQADPGILRRPASQQIGQRIAAARQRQDQHAAENQQQQRRGQNQVDGRAGRLAGSPDPSQRRNRKERDGEPDAQTYRQISKNPHNASPDGSG